MKCLKHLVVFGKAALITLLVVGFFPATAFAHEGMRVGENQGASTSEPIMPMEGEVTFTAFYVEKKDTRHLSDHDTLEEAVTACIADLKDNSGRSYAVSFDNEASLDSTIEIPNGLTIKISGGTVESRNLTQKKSLRHFEVKGSLTLESVILKTSRDVDENEYNGGVLVDGGFLTLGTGAEIRSCYSEVDGGAIRATNGATVELESGSKIISNKVPQSQRGGGIYAENKSKVLLGQEVSLEYNFAGYGGGIALNDSTLTMTKATISSNSATYQGGGVYAQVGSKITLEKDASIGKEVKSPDGTVSYLGNFATNGGGIALDNSTLTMTDATIFSNNATEQGGGVYAENWSEITLKENASIGKEVESPDGAFSYLGNSATNGAGIALNDSTLTMTENATIFSNNATEQGGGVYAQNQSKITFKENASIGKEAKSPDGTVSYLGNSATNGGGIALNGSTLTMTDATIFSNDATDQGGGVYLEASTLTMNGSATLSSNDCSSAGASGGGLYATSQSQVEMNDSASISNNTVDSGLGGGVTLNGSSMKIEGGSVSDNTAGHTAGIALREESELTMNGGEIRGNKSIYDSAKSASGFVGGVFVSNGSTFNLVGGSIIDNESVTGAAGVYVESTDSQKTTTFNMYGGTISNNVALNEIDDIDYGHGGGVQVSSSCFFNMYGGTISNNTAIEGNGGGIYGSEATINISPTGQSPCIIEGNEAQHGAGLYLANMVSVILKDVEIKGNTASINGGGIYLDNGSEVELSGGSIEQNSATGSGGGVYVGDESSFIMKVNTSASDNTVMGENEADILEANSAGDDLYATGVNTSVTLLDTAKMPLMSPLHQAWYHDESGKRYRDEDSRGIYNPEPNDRNQLALALGNSPIVTLQVVYGANGGTGAHVAPVNQGDSHIVMTLASTGISRDNYEFVAWNTAADGSGTKYLPGDTITVTAEMSLFAQWKAKDGLKGDTLAKASDNLNHLLGLGLSVLMILGGAALIIKARRCLKKDAG